MTHDEMKRLGAGREAPHTVALLYSEAFERYGIRALWSRKPSAHPTIAQAIVIADTLRREGDMQARVLAENIEEACRAAL